MERNLDLRLKIEEALRGAAESNAKAVAKVEAECQSIRKEIEELEKTRVCGMMTAAEFNERKSKLERKLTAKMYDLRYRPNEISEKRVDAMDEIEFLSYELLILTRALEKAEAKLLTGSEFAKSKMLENRIKKLHEEIEIREEKLAEEFAKQAPLEVIKFELIKLNMKVQIQEDMIDALQDQVKTLEQEKEELVDELEYRDAYKEDAMDAKTKAELIAEIEYQKNRADRAEQAEVLWKQIADKYEGWLKSNKEEF